MDRLLSGRRVLVVEDEMMVLLMIEDMLADLGCDSVTAASSISQAVGLIDTQVFDAAMLDMNLGGNKSHPVADALAAHDVPFFFSTGYSGHDMKEGYRNRPLLKKPFQQQELARVFSDLLSH